jgi:transcriptional regulator with XRE-family HTH domain
MKILRLPKKDCVAGTPNFGAKILQARTECGLSQKELAKEIGFDSATAISLMESGQRGVSAKIINRIAYITNLPIAFFFED